MSTAADLAALLGTTADLNYYTQQLNYWSSKYEANSEKLQMQVKYETQWEKAYDDAIDNTRELSASLNGACIKVAENNTNKTLADKYAHAKVQKYDAELSAELAELDTDYDTMKTMYETLVTQLKAQEEGQKNQTGQDAQNNYMLTQ